jgi:phosphoribosylglycinamide formyltransferase-1
MSTAAPVKLGVLISGEGTNLQAMIDAVARGELCADLRVVIANRAEAGGLRRAERARIPCEVISHRDFTTREDFDRALVRALQSHEVELVACAGFMRLLSPVMLRAFPNRILNIHPALCPAFPGVDAVRQALAYGARFTGCTVFFVTEGVDDGPVIIHAEEHRIYPYAIRLYQEGRLEVRGRKVLIRDYPPAASVALINPRP